MLVLLAIICLVGCQAEPDVSNPLPEYRAKHIGYLRTPGDIPNIRPWGAKLYEVEIEGNIYLMTYIDGGVNLCPKQSK
jgi:hypothetical protein